MNNKNVEEKKKLFYRIIDVIKVRMIAGIIILIPLLVTLYLLTFAFETLDGFFAPIFTQIFGRKILGVGFIVLLLLTFLLGTISKFAIVTKIIQWIESLILKTPLFGAIYNTTREVASSFQGGKSTGFTTPVTIEYPKSDVWTMGFLTRTIEFDEKGTHGIVYMPSTPVPSTGWVVLVPIEKINFLDLKADQAMKLIVAGGIASSGKLKFKNINQ